MSIYWSGPEALRAEHEYRADRLSRPARWPGLGRRRRGGREGTSPTAAPVSAPVSAPVTAAATTSATVAATAAAEAGVDDRLCTAGTVAGRGSG